MLAQISQRYKSTSALRDAELQASVQHFVNESKKSTRGTYQLAEGTLDKIDMSSDMFIVDGIRIKMSNVYHLEVSGFNPESIDEGEDEEPDEEPDDDLNDEQEQDENEDENEGWGNEQRNSDEDYRSHDNRDSYSSRGKYYYVEDEDGFTHRMTAAQWNELERIKEAQCRQMGRDLENMRRKSSQKCRNMLKLSFTVTMNASGLTKVAATGIAQAITVVYNAKITSLEDKTVTEKENEATVKFSNNPEDQTSYSLLEDKTRNYTFSIDASLLGYTGESYETDELIKAGKKADGSWITETTRYRSGTKWTDLAPLAGAKFALYKETPAAADYANETAALASSKLYTNTKFTGIVQSDATGRLNINGLDAGTYYLREVSAPADYIADNRTFTITIAATYETIQGGTYRKNVGTEESPMMVTVKYDAYDVLKGYTVAVNDGTGTTTSTYNIENKGPDEHKVVDKATYTEKTGEHFAGDAVTPINNTQGTQLPSTGGMGTTILYVGGSILVILASVLLITKRRMNAED